MKKIKLTSAEKAELKAELKKTYLYAKDSYDKYFRDLVQGKSDSSTRENLEIEKEIMRETLAKIENLKRM